MKKINLTFLVFLFLTTAYQRFRMKKQPKITPCK